MKCSQVEGRGGVRPLRAADAGVSGREAAGEESTGRGEETTGCHHGCEADEGVRFVGERRGGEDSGRLQRQGIMCLL